jgi:hypothetical protein
MTSMSRGRYRARAWLRRRLPGTIAELVSKGRSDCGAHEWYRSDEQTWRCYYCEPAVTHSTPWTREEQLQRTLGGISSTLRAVAMRGAPSGERELSELRRLVGEALASLPEEERRLQRLAAAPAAELSDLAQALQAG